MTDTPKLGLTLVEAAQAQKHVTVNEAFAKLDVSVQLSVIAQDVTDPPVAPTEGDAYIVPAGATGLWAGHADKIAAYDGTGWTLTTPGTGWRAYSAADRALYVFDGAWVRLLAGTTANGAATALRAVQEVVTVAGATTDTTIVLPNRSFVTGVSTYVLNAITGATSYDCGYSGGADAFGGSLGIAAGSNNVGAVGGFAVYSDEVITLVSNGGNFTGGDVIVALHYIEMTAPSA